MTNKKKHITVNLLILLNKDNPALSETFIQNHITFFNAKVLNIYNYVNINTWKKRPFYKRIFINVGNIIGFLRFATYVKRNRISHVLAEYGTTAADSVSYCKYLNLPLIAHFHGQDAHRYKVVESYKIGYKKLFDYASAIIVVSSIMLKSLLEMGAIKSKLFLNIYGVDFNKLPKKEIYPKESIITCVGRLVDKKAPYLVIMAFDLIALKYPNISLVMIGDGPLLEVCKRIVEAKSLSNRVIFKGAIPHTEVISYLSRSLIYVQHSVVAFDGDSEGTPNTILEACAIGLPVVSTNHAGISDVIIHNETGFLVAEGDVITMAKYLEMLIEDDNLRKRIGFNAREKFINQYELVHTLKKLRQIITLNES